MVEKNELYTTEEVVNILREKTDLIRSGSTVPTHKPRDLKEQFYLYQNGDVRKLYVWIQGSWKEFASLTESQKNDLTDGGNCSSHKHDDRYLYKENTSSFTPDGDYEPATKKYVDDNKEGRLKNLLVAGEDLVAQDPVRVGYDTSIDRDLIKQDSHDHDWQYAYNLNITVKYTAQSFKMLVDGKIDKVSLMFRLDDTLKWYRRVRVHIQTDSNGEPSGTNLVSSDWKCPTDMNYSDPDTETSFDLTSTQLSANTTYWIVMEVEDQLNCGGTVGGESYQYLRYYGNGTEYADGKMMYKTSDTSSWTDGGVSRDLFFKVYVQEELGQVYKCKATDANHLKRYIGIMNSAADWGDTIPEIKFLGTISKGGTKGDVYYISNTGELSTSPGSNEKMVGVQITDNLMKII